jgi:hypothetical protein
MTVLFSIGLMGVILLPLLVGILLLLFPRRIGAQAPVALLITAGIATLCTLPLIFGEREISLPITWLPGTGALTLHVGGVGSYAALATTGALFVVQWLSQASTLPEGKRNFQEDRPSIQGILLIALAATNASFLAGHFLGRYVALEAVGLCIALLPLFELRHRNGTHLSQSVYLTLRLGDAGLLVAILILMDASGTLYIEETLHIGETLDPRRLAWVVAGFTLAVWVKVGAWPFHRWQQTGRRLSPVVRTWLYGLVMPNLGLYLLYRITPLLILSTPLRIVVGGLGIGSGVAILASATPVFEGLTSSDEGQPREGQPQGIASTVPGEGNALPEKPPRGVAPGGFNAILGSVGLVLAASSAKSLVVGLLLIGIPLRLWLWLRLVVPAWKKSTATHADYEDLESGLFQVAHTMRRRVESGLLERGMNWTSQGVFKGAQFLHHSIEQEGLEGLLRVTAHSALVMSRWMQQRHTGRLRINLLWVAFSLIGLVALLIIKGW